MVGATCTEDFLNKWVEVRDIRGNEYQGRLVYIEDKGFIVKDDQTHTYIEDIYLFKRNVIAIAMKTKVRQ